MHIAYVDDSAQSGRRERQGKLIGLGAAVLAEEHVKAFADDFYSCYDEFGVPHEVELKWSPNSRADWFRQNDKVDVLQPLREAVLDAAIAHEARAFAAIWDEGAQKTMWGKPAGHWVITFLFERIAMYLEGEKNRGLIVFDKPGGNHKDEDAWISDTRALTDFGTDYVKADSIVAAVLTAPSHHHPQLQLADLIAGATVGAMAGTKFALPLVPRLKEMFHRGGWHGAIGGSGVKLYPDAICNLYHWVLGDDELTRGNSGRHLPWKGLGRYVENDGLTLKT
ncbi:DUF3800 domain-containing protein [Microbacterium maritypicum]|uniref:DUF3800 domain-containing protein n=1 Tax=Microbacterium maritypicum TaxID=33918 RepID=UPI003817B38B